MKGSPTEVSSMMKKMLTADLVKAIENKRDEMLNADEIIAKIGNTYIDWIKNTCEELISTGEDCHYLDDIWYKNIPDDYDKLAADISFILKDLEVTYVGAGADKGNIIFTHKKGFFVLLFLTESYFGERGIIDVHIRAGSDIDSLYEGLYK
jgi:hypothetical protein